MKIKNKKNTTLEKFYRKAALLVCECQVKEKLGARTYWKVIGAGFSADSDFKAFDIACKSCGEGLRIYYEQTNINFIFTWTYWGNLGISLRQIKTQEIILGWILPSYLFIDLDIKLNAMKLTDDQLEDFIQDRMNSMDYSSLAKKYGLSRQGARDKIRYLAQRFPNLHFPDLRNMRYSKFMEIMEIRHPGWFEENKGPMPRAKIKDPGLK